MESIRGRSREIPDYFANHLSRINGRNTYALVDKVMYHLFFDADRLFAPLYLHASRLLLFCCHFG